MKVSMESTSRTVIINGLNLRVWEGITDKGVPFVALVNRLQSPDPARQKDLVAEVMLKPKEPEASTLSALEQLGVAALPAPPTIQQ